MPELYVCKGHYVHIEVHAGHQTTHHQVILWHLLHPFLLQQSLELFYSCKQAVTRNTSKGVRHKTETKANISAGKHTCILSLLQRDTTGLKYAHTLIRKCTHAGPHTHALMCMHAHTCFHTPSYLSHNVKCIQNTLAQCSWSPPLSFYVGSKHKLAPILSALSLSFSHTHTHTSCIQNRKFTTTKSNSTC